MEKLNNNNVHIEEAAYDERDEIHKAVAAGLHVERKLLDGDDFILIQPPSNDSRGRYNPMSMQIRCR